MTPFYSDPWLTVYGGDCREVLRTLPAESVHTVVTSPPYWGLRDYGTASWEGGEEGCDHTPDFQPRSERPNPTGAGIGKTGYKGQEPIFKDACRKCGARRIDSQLGLEQTPEEYVAAMVDVFREVRRVLRSDGTVWLNLGDSYFGTGRGPTHPTGMHSGGNGSAPTSGVYRHATIKGKDLVGIPWRVAFALQADGWYLRSDIIWSKPNPMPESVTDRPTKSHEYLFLLAKSARYFFDADAVRQPHKWQDPDELAVNAQARQQSRLVEREAWRTQDEWKAAQRGERGKGRYTSDHKTERAYQMSTAGRNIRSVWTIATAPYPGAHFATFPPKLVEPCVKAGTSERGVCPECGAPWERVVEGSVRFESGSGWAGNPPNGKNGTEYEQATSGTYDVRMGPVVKYRTLGWRPTCRHEAEPVPAVVLDPFAGTGTVGMVAQSLSRRAILVDLNPDYLRQCLERNRDMPLGLAVG